jgi:hypothetical protein
MEIKISEVIARLQCILDECGDLPIFSAGEFNTLPHIEVYDKGFEWLADSLGDDPQFFPEGQKAVLI